MDKFLRENRLLRAWNFMEHWHSRLSAKDGGDRLEEFYGATFKFLQNEGLFRHEDVGKLDIP